MPSWIDALILYRSVFVSITGAMTLAAVLIALSLLWHPGLLSFACTAVASELQGDVGEQRWLGMILPLLLGGLLVFLLHILALLYTLVGIFHLFEARRKLN